MLSHFLGKTYSVQKFGVCRIFFMFFKEVSYAVLFNQKYSNNSNIVLLLLKF